MEYTKTRYSVHVGNSSDKENPQQIMNYNNSLLQRSIFYIGNLLTIASR